MFIKPQFFSCKDQRAISAVYSQNGHLRLVADVYRIYLHANCVFRKKKNFSTTLLDTVCLECSQDAKMSV